MTPSEFIGLRTIERDGVVFVRYRWGQFEHSDGPCECHRDEERHLAAVEAFLEKQYPKLKVLAGAEDPDYGYFWVLEAKDDSGLRGIMF